MGEVKPSTCFLERCSPKPLHPHPPAPNPPLRTALGGNYSPHSSAYMSSRTPTISLRWHRQDLNLRSPEDRVNTFLLHHLEAHIEQQRYNKKKKKKIQTSHFIVRISSVRSSHVPRNRREQSGLKDMHHCWESILTDKTVNQRTRCKTVYRGMECNVLQTQRWSGQS